MRRGSGRFAGQVAVVTGGSSGIGRAVCLSLAGEGASVVVVGRDRARVAETGGLAERTPGAGPVLALAAVDVRMEQDVERAARATLERFGRIDVLVASAGIGRAGASSGVEPVQTLDPGAWDAIIDTNLKGVFLAARAVLPSMTAQGAGQIVAIGSRRAGVAGQPYASAYSAAKFGLVGFCEALREEARDLGVRVHLVVPDAVDTPLIRGTGLARGGALSPAVVAAFVADLLALPEDVEVLHPAILPFTVGAGR